ncbi:flagellar hook-associated protein FlgK [Azotosporobacter soli]|uniref:flagellar hook-associated protein FlgK n=1 Tax=Azotosporobacter soli TaxID=3055040 RepID=UPI0031FE9702
MSSTFSTYSIAYTGLYVNQTALATTSSNLANVNTAGASRVRTASVEMDTVQKSGSFTGDGVSLASITRARESLMDKVYRTQNSSSTYYSVKSGNLQYLDQVLTEYEASSDATDSESTSDSVGLQQEITDFFSAWETVSVDSSTESSRTSVISAGTSLVEMLTSIDSQLQQLQQESVSGVKEGVDSLNDLASQVADLNGQISSAEANGSEATYLRDQRDALLDEMSSLANINVTQMNNTIQVSIGSITIVDGRDSYALEVDGTGTTSDPLTVKRADIDCKVAVNSGSIAAYLEDADQSGYEDIDSASLPYDFSTDASSSITNMRQALNVLITTLADKINTLATSGVDGEGEAGEAFFTVVDSSKPLSITNIKVNPNLVDDPEKLVTASSSDDGDNTIANQILELASEECYSYGGIANDITGFYAALTSWIGTTGDEASNNYKTQEALTESVANQRQSISGISVDEETANMIKLQNAYAASARVMSTVDSLLAGLIEDIG